MISKLDMNTQIKLISRLILKIILILYFLPCLMLFLILLNEYWFGMLRDVPIVFKFVFPSIPLFGMFISYSIDKKYSLGKLIFALMSFILNLFVFYAYSHIG